MNLQFRWKCQTENIQEVGTLPAKRDALEGCAASAEKHTMSLNWIGQRVVSQSAVHKKIRNEPTSKLQLFLS